MYKGKPDTPLTVARYLRNSRGMSIEELSVETGIKWLPIFHLEHGLGVDLDTIKKLAAYFDVSLDCLARNDLASAAKQLHSPNVRNNRMKDLLRRKEQICEEIGDRGEKLILEREHKRLRATPFALAVNGNVADDVMAGYDILSFTNGGEPIYIEVKTTTGNNKTPFFLSRCELAFLRECAEHGYPYQLHRIYNLNDNDEYDLEVLSAEELIENYEIIPVSYIVRRVSA